MDNEIKKTPPEYRELILFLNDIEKNVLNIISSILSEKLTIHEVEILLAPWCRTVVHSIFGALDNLKIDKDRELFFDNAPGETIKFMEFSRSDSYLDYLKYGNKSYKINKTTRILKLPFFSNGKFLFFQPGLPKKIINNLIIYYFFSYKKLSSKRKEVYFSINNELRLKIFRELENRLDINNKTWFAARLVEMLPRSLAEGLNYQIEKYSRDYKFRYIYSSDSWSSVDEFKIFAFAQRKLRNITFIGTPHSLNYSTLKNFWNRDYEISFMDKYLLWGSINISNNNKCTPFYSNKYISKKYTLISKVNMDLPILITGAARPSHTIEFPYTSTLFKTYLQNQILISKIINQILNKKVTIRTREKNRGNQIENIIQEYKNLEFLSIDYQKNEFNKVLRNYSLHITDNTSTTILDSFILNFPTIIILDNTYFKLSDVAQFSFTGLEKVGIFHKNINSFSNHLVLINNEINNWWNSENVQFEISKFLDYHAGILINTKNWKSCFEKTILSCNN